MTGLPEAFYQVHSGLKREAPGDAESLSWALELARTPVRARILDAGCGPGADLAVLARLRPGAALVGIDLHAPFIERIRAEQPDVEARVGNMLAPDGFFDLIWSAGAANGPGVETALATWRNHLRPGGAVAFSDCLWRSATPAAEARAFWAQEYPGMVDLAGHMRKVEAAGWRVLGARWLGEGAWRAYYDPLAARIARLRPDATAEMTAVLDATQAEIDLWRRHGDDYGYYLTVAVPA